LSHAPLWPDHSHRRHLELSRPRRPAAHRRAWNDGGARARLPFHGPAHRHDPEPAHLPYRAGRESARRRAARCPRSETAAMIRDALRRQSNLEGTMRKFLQGTAAAISMACVSPAADAQTLNMMKAIDAPHYDAQRTTWAPTSDIVNMIQDTLVALDWD